MWLLRRKPLLDPEIVDWMFAHVEWLFAHHAHREGFARAKLLPIADECFPRDGSTGHALAERMLAQVMDYAFVADLPVVLMADPRSGRFKHTGSVYVPEARSDPAGTHWFNGVDTEITYDTDLLNRPADLVATLAHEISHAVLALGCDRDSPGTEESEEMLTDLTAIFLGFGFYLISFRAETRVISADLAKTFLKTFTDYMSLREACFATALFATIKGIDRRRVLKHAGGEAASHLKRAFADLDGENARIARIHEMMRALLARSST